MSKPTPADYVLHHACVWRDKDKACLRAPEGPKKEAAEKARDDETKKLRYAVDKYIESNDAASNKGNLK
jgi:hypothetical protein